MSKPIKIPLSIKDNAVYRSLKSISEVLKYKVNYSPEVPSAANAVGEEGMVTNDSDYLYVCTDKDTWKSTKLRSVGSDSEVKTYQFELDNYKKGNTAPATVYTGTAPRITALEFNNVLQRVALTFMVPLDWNTNTDMQFMCMVAIPAATTHTVGDIINLTMESHTGRHLGTTKLDGVRQSSDSQVTSTSSPFNTDENDNVILSGKNTEYYIYMPHIIIPKENLVGGVGGVFYAEIGLNSIAAGNVPSILIYQMHVNYFGLPQ
jgi:hypothetical protein